MRAIEVNNLTKTFVTGKEEAHVLKKLDFSVEKGEFVSIMGPSGSGKSTLFYLLGGLDKPTSGSVILDGKKLKMYEDKLTQILDTIGLSDKRKAIPRELSGGQQQRVAIARALISEPDILFLDEPIGNLDSKAGKGIVDLFKKINVEYGKTLIQVTHSQKAAQYGTSIIRLVDGEIVEQSDVIDI